MVSFPGEHNGSGLPFRIVACYACSIMARPLHMEYAGALYHVTTRGNAREKIFFIDWDRDTFFDPLCRAMPIG